MRKLNDVVNGLSLKDNGKSNEMLMVLNQIVSGKFDVPSPDTTKERKHPENKNHFKDLLKQCLEIVDSRKQEMNQIDDNVMSEEDDSDSDMGGNGDIWGRKRKFRYASTRRYQRASLLRGRTRSRNVTIDNWLAMDDYDIRSHLEKGVMWMMHLWKRQNQI